MNKILMLSALIFIGLSQIASGIDTDSKWAQMVVEGESLLQQHKAQAALDTFLEPVIKQFESTSTTNTAQIYCARDSKESLLYMIQAAAMQMAKDGEVLWGNQFADKKDNAVVLPQFWAEAFYLKGYALIELGQITQAKAALQTAVSLSPMNFNYLAELGHIYQVEKNWDMALEAFTASEEASTYSHPEQKDFDLARAWRGLGYVYVELGQLKNAQEKYKQCLELNPNDQTASAELNYINTLPKK